MAFTTMTQVVAALPGQRLSFEKSSSTAAGQWATTWLRSGLPIIANDPTPGVAGEIPTSATFPGALPLVNAGTGSLYLARMHGSTLGISAGAFTLYDRLWHNSGINVTSTSAQAINSIALNRPDALGEQAEVWWEARSTMGAATPAVTLSYTDQDGNAGQTALSGTLPASLVTSRTGPFQLDVGDTGVRSVQTWTADTSFISGTIGLVIRRRIMDMPLPNSGTDSVNDVLRSALSLIRPNACLEFTTFGTSATMTSQGELLVIEG